MKNKPFARRPQRNAFYRRERDILNRDGLLARQRHQFRQPSRSGRLVSRPSEAQTRVCSHNCYDTHMHAHALLHHAGFAAEEHLIFISGHYEGIDQRVIDHWVDEEISLGDYVLTNGAIAAVVVMDALVRLLPGVLGDDMSAVEESFGENGLLEAPQYTKPAEFAGLKVPEVLLGGNHAKIAAWRHEQALERTRQVRPDLLLTDPPDAAATRRHV